MVVAKEHVISAPTAPLAEAALDEILALQFLVAWAGEGRCKPRRLGWWDTDLVDPDGGGDLLARLAPRTHAWAALEAVREAARQTDTKARERHGEPDRVRTIFFLGFEVDEKVSARLAAHTLDEAGEPNSDQPRAQFLQAHPDEAEAARTKEAQRRARKATKGGSDHADTPLLDRADEEAEADGDA
jgi:hypothetical protein